MEPTESPINDTHKVHLVHYEAIEEIRHIPNDNMWAIYLSTSVLFVKDPAGFKPGDRVKITHEKVEQANEVQKQTS